MWREIGIKEICSDKSISQVSGGSSERRYRRRRPYNESDSIDYVHNQFSRMDVPLILFSILMRRISKRKLLNKRSVLRSNSYLI